MRAFRCREIDEAYAYAKAGGQALHLHTIIVDRKRAPRCFVQAVDAGQPIAHLFDQDEARLVAAVKRLGVRVVKVEHPGRLNQHVDLCGKPLAKAMEVVMGSWEEAYEECGRLVAGVALDRATYTGRPFVVECGPNGFGWTARQAGSPPAQGWTRVIEVQPEEDEVGVMKRLATARQQGQKVPPAVLKWATGQGTKAAPKDPNEYTAEEIIPIPAKCPKCKRNFVGKEAINAPTLRWEGGGCACFYCGSMLVPHPDYPDFIDAARRRAYAQAGETPPATSIFPPETAPAEVARPNAEPTAPERPGASQGLLF